MILLHHRQKRTNIAISKTMTKLKHHENYLISMHFLNSAHLKKCDPHSNKKKTTTWHTLSKMIGESVFIGNDFQVDTFIF